MLPSAQGDLHSSRSDEPPGAQNELGARVPVILHIHLVQADDHLALALSDARHVDREAIVCDAELFASAKVRATFALWMMFLLGRHAIFGHDPPIYLRSTTATRLPSPANVHAATVEPVPPPRITRSNSSGCDFLRTGRMEWSRCSSCDFSFLSDRFTLGSH